MDFANTLTQFHSTSSSFSGYNYHRSYHRVNEHEADVQKRADGYGMRSNDGQMSGAKNYTVGDRGVADTEGGSIT